MNQFIRDVLTSKDFITSFIVAVTFFVVGKSWNMLWRFFQSLRQSFREFSVAGFWVGTCALPSYAGRHSLEVWRFTHKRERIQFHFFAYPPPGCGHNNRSAGMGVFSGGVMSAVYYSLDPSSNESGVLALRVRGRCLTGVYAQYDLDTPEETFFASDDTYSLHRVRLPFAKAMMYAFGVSPFKDYAEVARFCADTPLANRLEPVT